MSLVVYECLRESWLVLGEMAPYLLFGFLVAGILSICISPGFIERHLGGRGFGPVVKAGLFGVPMPLCSCGVIPVAASFRRHGASRAATTSFLLSTPQTGLDNITVVYGLLGGVFAIISPIVALIMGLLGGLLVWLFGERNDAASAPAGVTQCGESCCTEKGQKNLLRRALEYGFVTLPRDIGLAVLVGVVIAGSLAALVPANQWQQYLGGGLWSMLLMMAIGIPIYVCASASVPIAAGLIHLGASPGAALAFLISGPASNAATVTTIWKTLGPRTMFLYVLTIILSAIGGGMALDWLFPTLQIEIASHVSHVHEAEAISWISHAWAVALLGVFAFSYAARPRAKINYTEELERGGDLPDTEFVEIAVEGMTCDHCAGEVAQALQKCPGVRTVAVDRKAGKVSITGRNLDAEDLAKAIGAAGFQTPATPRIEDQ